MFLENVDSSMKPLTKKILWLTIFSIAMGYMESAIVVYLRALYYPNGFGFPLVMIGPDIGLTEVLREAATIIMLIGIGQLAGKTASQRFTYFLYCFAIWDIFYYIFLKLLIGWPESLFTWDILFLIPVPWVGPVIAPCIVSFVMIMLAGSVEFFHEKGKNTKITPKEWTLFITGSLVVITSFVWDYFKFRSQPAAIIPSVESDHLFYDISTYVPQWFNWPLFLIGEGIIIFGLLIFIMRMRNS